MTALKIETQHVKCDCTPTVKPAHCHLCSAVVEVRTPWEFCITQRDPLRTNDSSFSEALISTGKE